MTFGSPILFSQNSPTGGVRWMPIRKNKFTSEEERMSAPTMSVILGTAVAVGDVVARGAFVGNPWTAAEPYEVTEYRETDSLIGSGTVKRATCAPLFGVLHQTILVYRMVRTDTVRSFTVARHPTVAYNGPASVRVLNANQVSSVGSMVLQHDCVVTIPMVNGLLFAAEAYEIDWNGPYGQMTIETLGPTYSDQQSPFWQTIAGKIRRPAVGST
jgi:hypothetical protein